MLTLALDTTTRAGSVAVVRGDAVLSVVHGDATRTHGERLPTELEQALQLASVNAGDLQLLVVASGPGGFTGLRIGLAAIQGFAMVLKTPTIGVSALDALALCARDSSDAGEAVIVSCMDAQRGEVFAAVYDLQSLSGNDSIPVEPPMVATPADVLDRLRENTRPMLCIGDGATRYREEIVRAHPDSVVIEGPAALAPFLARLGSHRAARGHAGPPHALQPLYVRRPDAELERARRS
jgi:tRNA threonylcarbamoyladenosine biosynthesis protein TsaB